MTSRGVTKRFKGLVALRRHDRCVCRNHPRHRRPERLGQDDALQHRHGRLRAERGLCRAVRERASQVGAPTASRGTALARTFQGVRLFRSLTVRRTSWSRSTTPRPLSVWQYILAPWLVLVRERDAASWRRPPSAALPAQLGRGLPRHEPAVRAAAAGRDRAGDGGQPDAPPARRAGGRA